MSTIHPRIKLRTSSTQGAAEPEPVAFASPFKRHVFCEIHGETKLGCPVVAVHLVSRNAGAADLIMATEAGRNLVDEYLEHGYRIMELIYLNMWRNRNRLGWTVSQFVAVINVQEVHLRYLVAPTILRQIRNVLRFYDSEFAPEVKEVFIINASTGFRTFFVLLKLVLTTETRRKITVLGRNEAQWQKQLFKRIPRDAVPPELGGCFQLHSDVA